jgi:hypothetical protein
MAENRAYAGGTAGMWALSGLNKFELAHVFAHKIGERSFEREIFSSVSDTVEPYGLFTSASNVVLIPKGFAKPTDHMQTIKMCFYKRHLDLYGNNLIGLSDFRDSLLPEWYGEIKWVAPILPNDWEVRTRNLLKYRGDYLERKYT